MIVLNARPGSLLFLSGHLGQGNEAEKKQDKDDKFNARC